MNFIYFFCLYRINHLWSHSFGYNVCFCFSVQGCMYSCLARAQEKECNCTEGKFRTVSGICSETSDGNALFLFRFTMGLNKRWGSRDCTVLRARRLEQMWPGIDFLSLLSVRGLFVLALSRGLFSVFSVLLPPQKTWTKTDISNFKFH